jgi:hypothetical protein
MPKFEISDSPAVSGRTYDEIARFIHERGVYPLHLDAVP